MPPIAILILNGITAAISAAPQVMEIVQKGKELITALTGAGIITAEQQDTLHAHVDAELEKFKSGDTTPPAWLVEKDPE